MQWYELFNKENEPTEAQVSEYISSPLFGGLDDYLRQAHKVKLKLAYSGCAMDKINEAELLMPLCSEYTQELFGKCETFQGGKYLGFELRDENVLQDMKGLIDVRVRVK
jgi:AraC family transcriptional regulator